MRLRPEWRWLSLRCLDDSSVEFLIGVLKTCHSGFVVATSSRDRISVSVFSSRVVEDLQGFGDDAAHTLYRNRICSGITCQAVRFLIFPSPVPASLCDAHNLLCDVEPSHNRDVQFRSCGTVTHSPYLQTWHLSSRVQRASTSSHSLRTRMPAQGDSIRDLINVEAAPIPPQQVAHLA